MPNIGLPELVIVLVIALVVFGPKRLPDMGRQIGRALREFRSATAEIRSQMGVDEIADSVNDIRSGLSLTADSPRSSAETVAEAPGDESPAGGELGGVSSAAAREPVAAGTTVSDAPAAGSFAGAAPDAGEPLETDPVMAVPPAAGEGGVETFGSLKRGSASPPARAAND